MRAQHSTGIELAAPSGMIHMPSSRKVVDGQEYAVIGGELDSQAHPYGIYSDGECAGSSVVGSAAGRCGAELLAA